MKKLQKLISLLTLLLTAGFVFAQTGTVRGTLTDGSNGETIPFANILITETGGGVSTDLDGQYSVELPVGLYTFTVSYIGYADLAIDEIEVTKGQVNVMDLALLEETEMIQQVVVTAKALRNTEAALMTIQKKAPGLLDGITTQAIKRTGDSNVGSAIKRVTGVSVEGGKYVVVRGLGDRYSKTVLNGLEVPGLDPDRNSVQLDIFPTNLIDNILVYKSFTPDLPGDFTGGLVNIETKDFPETKTLSISASVSHNPSMNLKGNFITYEGSGTDNFGFDNGSRENPLHPYTTIPDRTENSPYLTQLTNTFSPIMSTMRDRSGLNTNYSLSYGNQLNKEKFDLGYTFSANYSNAYEFYENAEFGIYFKDLNDSSVNDLFNDRQDKGQIGSHNVLWSTLLGTAIKTKRHKLSFSALHSQNGESRAAFINSVRKEFGQAVIEKHNLEYTQRSVTNLLLKGVHSFKEGDMELNWKLSPTMSDMTEPDIRLTAYEINPDSGAFELNPSTAGIPTRTFRDLQEMNYSGRVDLIYKLDNGEVKHKLKTGFYGVYKDRDFTIFDYTFPFYKRGTFQLTGNPDELFYEENVWSTENARGTYLKAAFEPSKTYQAQQQILSGYVMDEVKFDSWKIVAGLRVEKADNWYTGRKQFIANPETDLFQNRRVLNEFDLLPSLGIVKVLKESDGKTMNLRGSFAKTLARPTFKEKSIAQIADRISGRLFIGNIDLEQVSIYNADLRWEYFLPKGQMVSLSPFYKHFTNPIELTAFDATAPSSFTPRNVGDANLLGIEFEMRNNLGTLSNALSDITFNLNTTFVHSSVNMTDNEYEGRLIAQRDGETIDKKRQMVGQSPFLINAGLTYIEREKGWEANMAYNVQGRRLAIVGIANVPDVYENAFHSLNLKLSKQLGADQKLKVSLGARNILNSAKRKVYQSYNTSDQLFENFEEGRSFSAGLSYRFF